MQRLCGRAGEMETFSLILDINSSLIKVYQKAVFLFCFVLCVHDYKHRKEMIQTYSPAVRKGELKLSF